MKQIEYFRKTLSYPVTLPIFIYVVLMGLTLILNFFQSSLFDQVFPALTALLLGYLIIGGIPYTFFAFLIYRWSFKTSLSRFKTFSLIFPLLFSSLYIPFIYHFTEKGVEYRRSYASTSTYYKHLYYNPHSPLFETIQTTLGSTFILIGYCYIYVIIAFVGLHILQKKGIVENGVV